MDFSCLACCNDYGRGAKSFDIRLAWQCKAPGNHLITADIWHNIIMSQWQIQREKLVARETAFEKEFKHSSSFSEERYIAWVFYLGSGFDNHFVYRSDEDPNIDFNDRPRNILSVAASRQRWKIFFHDNS